MKIQKKFYSLTGTSHLSPIEKLWSMVTFFLGTVSLFLVIIIADQPRQALQKFISPLVESLHMFSQTFDSKKNQNTFSFVPGWTYTKYDDINMSEVNTLAFFDLPINADGTLDEENAGYRNFYDQAAADLFALAHTNGKKVVVTVSQTHNPSIEQFLSDQHAQGLLVKNVITAVKEVGVDGVTVDFEYSGTAGSTYRQRFTDFIALFSQQLHAAMSNGQVNVALNPTSSDQALYDVAALAKNADHIYVMAYTFAVPESNNNITQAPVFGYKEEAYWKDINTSIAQLSKFVPEEKLVLERAWYGNGDDYPFYQSTSGKSGGNSSVGFNNTLQTPLDEVTINGLVSEVPAKARGAARQSVPLIAKALEDEGILTANVLAYALATIEHETAGTFEPLEEFKGRKSARRLGYEGGTNYFGRGYIQLTHLRNYQAMGERIGMGDALVRNPDLAAQPEVAAKVLAVFFKQNGVATLAYKGRFVQARTPINPDYQGTWIANLAWKYLYMIG